ncbi:MAG TPA: glycine betaine ABC transporter substrate-binding protein [Conexibacter sp.]|nr:glycine betaine ABC transporter substrate-binding protein [Conexibacter sp.]
MRRSLLPFALALLLAVAGCGGDDTVDGPAPAARALPGDDRPVVTLGSRTSTEQILLGQLYKQALEAQGFRVRLKQNIGSTRIADAALRNGEIDAYPEYLGVWNRAVARDRTAYADVRTALAAARSRAAAEGFVLLDPTRFEHVDAVAVTSRLAERHGLTTIGDLRSVRDLRLGAPPELYTSPNGLPGLARAYGLNDVDYAPLTAGMQYPLLDDERLDAAIVRLTDGQLAEGDRVLLDDPLDLFGVEPLVPVVAARTLTAEGPDFERTLNAVSAALTTRAMQELNAATTIEHRSAEDVARDFLREHDLA